ncbi:MULTISPECIES: hypothetical protein [unclassified Kitasatospora]|uniref:hypothetical protein n=1 Tax=unclassified Kitasatospora TaxID=2633591 RepID=UPI00382A5185
MVAVAGALLAQIWWLGAPGAYAAAPEPLPEPVNRTVGRALHGGQAFDGASAERPSETGRKTSGATGARGTPPQDAPAGLPGPVESPGLVGQLTGTAASVPSSGTDTVTGLVGGVLQERIRAGGLPLPGQRAAVPDAFAIASGLLEPAPAEARTPEARASRSSEPETPSSPDGRTGAGTPRPAPADDGRPGQNPPPPVREAADLRSSPGSEPPEDGADGAGTTRRPAPEGRPAAYEDLALTDPATMAAGHGPSDTGIAVLAPIAAGLLLTGAAMWKHRGLPRGH